MFELSIFLKDRLIGRSTFGLDEVRIGRSADNEVRIDNPALSRYHASIEAVAGIHLLKDFGSQNGTFVNGERVQGRAGLNSGDKIQVGKFTLTFRTERKATVDAAEVTDQASYAVAGKTLILRAPVVERSCPWIGYLESAADVFPPPRYVVEKDFFLVGSAPASDLPLPKAAGAPERSALLVRSWQGFSVVALAPGVVRNRAPVQMVANLQDGDTLTFGEAAFVFHAGRPHG